MRCTPGTTQDDSRLGAFLKSIPGARRMVRALRRKRALGARLDPIPGVGWMIRSFIQTPGSFLFTSRLLRWLEDPAQRRPLPPLYRFFAFYSRALPRNSRGVAFGSELMFRCVSWWTRRLGLRDEVELTVDSHAVCLNLTDPRSLAVPNEIRTVRALLADFLQPGDSFVDVGANHGSFSVVASRLVGAGGRVVAVEPQPRLARLIRRSLEAAGSAPFSIYEMAFADASGTETFYVPRATSGPAGLFRSYSARSAAEELTVRVGRFDDRVDWRALPGRVVMKLDVEGSEYRFLDGAREALLAKNPCLFLEINPASLRAAEVSEEMLVQRLKELGYQAYVEEGDSVVRDLAALDASVPQNIVLLSKSAHRERMG